MSDTQSSHIPVGTILEGKFRVTQEIGRGGMAAVYEAENVDIGKRVAVKILSPELISSRIVRERFIREARSAAAIHSPYICEVYDSGMYHERPFLVMELLDGESLYDRMTRVRKLKVSTTLKVLRHIVRGLAKAHQAGVVHRDLKPENIFLTRDSDGRLLAKIVDFGLAKFYESRDGEEEKNIRLTREGALFGTPAYMSPEQARGQGAVDHRADLWALGCIVYECLTGQTVWDVEQGVAMILAQIARGQLPNPQKYRPDLPDSFTLWFQQALNPDLSQRFQTGRDFMSSLEAALSDTSEVSTPSNPRQLSSAFEIPDPASSLTNPPPSNREGAPHHDGATGRAITWLSVSAVCMLSAYAFWLYVLNPSVLRVDDLGAASERRNLIASAVDQVPAEKGPGAELINRAQKQLRSDQHDEAIATLEKARGENPTVADSLIRHLEVTLNGSGSCRLAGLGRPRPFDSTDPASHARVVVGSAGILAMWTDTHQDPKRRNVYSAILDDSLRRIGEVRNATPESKTAIHPTITNIPDGFATLYWNSAGSKPGVYVRSLQADGRIRTASQLLSGEKRDKYFPTLTALPGGEFISIWSEKNRPTDRRAIMALHLDKMLVPRGSPVALTAFHQGDATQPFASVFEDKLFVAYRYIRAGQTSEIRLQRVALESEELRAGVVADENDDRWVGENITLRTEPRQAEPSMSCDAGGCLVVWDDEAAGAFAAFVPSHQKAPLWHREFSTKGKRPVIARNADGDALIAYFAGDRLFVVPVDRDGIGEPSVISRVSGFQPAPSLRPGKEKGEWLIAWRDYEAGHLEVFVARAQCRKKGAP